MNRPLDLFILLSVVLLAAAPLYASETNEERRSTVAAESVRTFAPGVRIDWQNRLVEVDARVVLREGMLELLACSPQTREHESVFVVGARPWHIFQAMGLIGIEPGRPVRYDAEKERMLPAEGDAVEILVRCEGAKEADPIPTERFVMDPDTERPPPELPWVFSGSRKVGEAFGADLEGTVACVVDFETALISLDSLHSADNELLWLAANTVAIPPIGTRCTLLIQRGPAVIEVTVALDKKLRIDGAAIGPARLLERIKEVEKKEGRSVRVVLRGADDTPPESLEAVVDALARSGVDRQRIKVDRGE